MARIRRLKRKGEWKVGECNAHKKKYVFAEKWAHRRHMKQHHNVEIDI